MASQAQASNNDNDVKIHRAPPDVTNTTTHKGLKDLAYVPGNVRPETLEPVPRSKRITILTPPGKGNKDNITSKGTGILTVALLVY